jgi:tetratricopeptide (TPR) repeat protein
MGWSEQAEEAIARYDGGEERDLDQRQLTQLANAAWAAGLCLLMAGRREEAGEWLRRAAQRYRESWDAGAPPDSWGRPIAAMKALLLAGDDASGAARWALDAGAADSESPIGRYSAALAYLVLGRDVDARIVAETIVDRDDFPRDVADAVLMIAGLDRTEYLIAVEDLLDDFEHRENFLEGIRVADTVMVLQILAGERDMGVELPLSHLLPSWA